MGAGVLGTHKTSISRESATKRNGIGKARARDEVRRNGTIHRLHTVENGIEARKYPEVEPQLTYLPYVVERSEPQYLPIELERTEARTATMLASTGQQAGPN